MSPCRPPPQRSLCSLWLVLYAACPKACVPTPVSSRSSYVVIVYILLVFIFIACTAMAYIACAHIAMTCVVMAEIVEASIVMAHIGIGLTH